MAPSSSGTVLLRDPAAGLGYRYDPAGEGALALLDGGNETLEGGRSDAAEVTDRAGNRYVSTPAGIQVSSFDGRPLGTIRPPRTPVRLAWGDEDLPTLYMTARGGLYRMRLGVGGVRP